MTDNNEKLEEVILNRELGVEYTEASNPRFHMASGAGEKDAQISKVKSGEIVSQQDWGDVNEVDRDYEYQRQNFYNLVERGTEAVDGILELAKESDHPRAYEVAGNLIKQVADVTEKLGDLQKKMKELKEVPNNAPKNVTNALFVGSTAELQKLMKEK